MDFGAFQNTALLILVQIAIVIGIVGLLIPVFPGLLITWAAILVYGLVTGFSWWGAGLFAVISLVGVAASLADNILMAGGARTSGASWSSILLALGAGIIGTLLLPPFGGLVAAPLAVLLLEYYRRRDWDKSQAALTGMIKGYGVAFVLRVLGGLLMMILWWAWVILEL